MRKELKAPSPSHSRGTSRLVLAQRPGGLQQELSGTDALAESASLTMLSRVRQVSEMAEDGSEEIMFICKWPAPGPPRRRRDACCLGEATSTLCVCVREALALRKLK